MKKLEKLREKTGAETEEDEHALLDVDVEDHDEAVHGVGRRNPDQNR